MTFASPIWLAMLAPWVGLALWLLWGQPEHRGVPFLKLWSAEHAQFRKRRRAWSRPPLAILALLAALLLAVFASAGPVIQQKRNPPAGDADAPDVLIERLAIRPAPTTQAMVRLRNLSEFHAASLTIRADGNVVQSVSAVLPARGQSRNYFLDFPVSAARVEAEVEFDDGRIHSSEAVLGTAWPKIEAKGPLPAELRRMIEVYTRLRPPGEGSIPIAVEMVSDPVPETQAISGAFVTDATFGRGISNLQPLYVRDHALTNSADWETVLSGAKVSTPPPGDWQTLVSVAGAPVLAIRDQPVRQVWVGFASDDFPRRADFVVFWSNVFNWLGRTEAYVPAEPSRPPQKQLMAPAQPKDRSLAGPTVLAVLALMCLSAAKWKATAFISLNPGKS